MKKQTILLLALVACVPGTLIAEEWGDLTVKFVYDGSVPAATKLNVTKDVAFCGKFDLVDESLVVDAKTGGIANIIGFLYKPKGLTVHPDLQKQAGIPVKLDNKGCRFEPYVTFVQTGQSLVLSNSDTVGHNSKVDTLINAPINPIIPAGASIDESFVAPEPLPVTVSCSIHPWMSALIVVKDNPYMAASGKDGSFVIKNIPVGKWTFRFWHKRSGYVSDLSLNGKTTEWKKGRVEVDIKPGKNDLGVAKISPGTF